MPIHDYQCEKCGHTFEKTTYKIEHEKDSTECPECKEIAKKLISAGSFIIHGFNVNNGYSGHMR